MVLPMVSERDTVLHSWCVPAQWQAPTIVGGRGAHFWDADGHDYLDMSSLSECSNLGHQHPAVVKAICEQAERSCFVTSAWGAEPRAELAKVLLEKAGFERGRVFFTLAGADANEHAVKFARLTHTQVKPKAAAPITSQRFDETNATFAGAIPNAFVTIA